MTRDEAIMWLNAERKARCRFVVLGEGSLLVEAIDMAIEALSADRPIVAYVCDGRACDADCSECFRTTNIEHALHFERMGDRYMEKEDRPSEERMLNEIKHLKEQNNQLEELYTALSVNTKGDNE